MAFDLRNARRALLSLALAIHFLSFLVFTFAAIADPSQYTIVVEDADGNPVPGVQVFGNYGIGELSSNYTDSQGKKTIRGIELDGFDSDRTKYEVGLIHPSGRLEPAEFRFSDCQPDGMCHVKFIDDGSVDVIDHWHFRHSDISGVLQLQPFRVYGSLGYRLKNADYDGYAFTVSRKRVGSCSNYDGNPATNLLTVVPYHSAHRYFSPTPDYQGYNSCPTQTQTSHIISNTVGGFSDAGWAEVANPTFRFKVKNINNGFGVAGVNIDGNGISAKVLSRVTNSLGEKSFKLSDYGLDPDATYHVTFSHPSYKFFPESLTLTKGWCETACDIYAIPDPTGQGLVRVKVDSVDGPVSGVEISVPHPSRDGESLRLFTDNAGMVYLPAKRQASCNDNDDYSLNDSFSLSASLAGCSFAEALPYKACITNTTHDVTLHATCDGEAPSDYAVEGFVYDKNGHPASGVAIFNHGSQITASDENGRWKTLVAVGSNNTFSAFKENSLFDPQSKDIVDVFRAQNQINFFEMVDELGGPTPPPRPDDCEAQTEVELSGTVFGMFGGRLENIYIYNQHQLVGQTDASGNYSLIVPAGSDNWITASAVLDPEANPEGDLFFDPFGHSVPNTLCPKSDLHFQVSDTPTVLLKGKVTWEGGAAVKGVELVLTIDGKAGSEVTTTDSRGVYYFSVLEEEYYTIEARGASLSFEPAEGYSDEAYEDRFDLDFIAHPVGVAPSPSQTPSSSPSATPTPIIQPSPSPSLSSSPSPSRSPVASPSASPSPAPGTPDNCPLDPNKYEPGVCGCGIPDDGMDSDGDGTWDCIDECITDPSKIEEGICGCGVADEDLDGNGTSDCADPTPTPTLAPDLCPEDPNKTVPGECGCGTVDSDVNNNGILDCLEFECDGIVRLLDFDDRDLPAGTVLTDHYSDRGISFGVKNNHGPDLLVIFDSANPTQSDTDLGTPNAEFGGPGTGEGRGNDRPLRNIIIVNGNDKDKNNDGLIDEPNDDPNGGSMFLRFNKPVEILAATVIDIETGNGNGNEPDALSSNYGRFYGRKDGNLLWSTWVDGLLGNNSVEQTKMPSTSLVNELEFEVGGSGALDEILYCEREERDASGLKLTSMCSEDPSTKLRWRVRNPKPFGLFLTWDVYGTSQNGEIYAPGNSDTYFYTDTVLGSPNTVRLFYKGDQIQVKASGLQKCPVDPAPTPTPTVTPTVTPTPKPNPFDLIDMIPICSNDPGSALRTRVDNHNTFPLELKWHLKESSQTGEISLGGGESQYIDTQTLSGKDNVITLALASDSGVSKSMLHPMTQCDLPKPEPTPTPTPPKCDPDSPTELPGSQFMRLTTFWNGSEINTEQSRPHLSSEGLRVACHIEPSDWPRYRQLLSLNGSDSANKLGWHQYISNHYDMGERYVVANDGKMIAGTQAADIGGESRDNHLYKYFIWDPEETGDGMLQRITRKANGELFLEPVRNAKLSGNGVLAAAEYGAEASPNILVYDVRAGFATMLINEELEASEKVLRLHSLNDRFIVFSTTNELLAPEDTNGRSDVFVYDVQLSTLNRVGNDESGNQLMESVGGSLSTDGRYLAYLGRTYGDSQYRVYLRDFVANKTYATSGLLRFEEGYTAFDRSAHVTAHGEVVFTTDLGLAEDDTNEVSDIYLVDADGSPQLLSIPPQGGAFLGKSFKPRVSSGEGRYVAFLSETWSVSGGSVMSSNFEVYVRDRLYNKTEVISRQGESGESSRYQYDLAGVTREGSVVFSSDNPSLVAGDKNGFTDVFATSTVDLCPCDLDKLLPGACGCGTPDKDVDFDGIADCNDPSITPPTGPGGIQIEALCRTVGDERLRFKITNPYTQSVRLDYRVKDSSRYGYMNVSPQTERIFVIDHFNVYPYHFEVFYQDQHVSSVEADWAYCPVPKPSPSTSPSASPSMSPSPSPTPAGTPFPSPSASASPSPSPSPVYETGTVAAVLKGKNGRPLRHKEIRAIQKEQSKGGRIAVMFHNVDRDVYVSAEFKGDPYVTVASVYKGLVSARLSFSNMNSVTSASAKTVDFIVDGSHEVQFAIKPSRAVNKKVGSGEGDSSGSASGGSSGTSSGAKSGKKKTKKSKTKKKRK